MVLDRFSLHPAIALPNLEPSEYGSPFGARAKAMLGSMLAVPSRETVMGLLLLALVAAGDGAFDYFHDFGDRFLFDELLDSESEVWMMTGMAVRMSLDLGLHIVSQFSQMTLTPFAGST